MHSRRIAVFGLGYVGLPLMRACINAGHTVVGVDVDQAKVASLNPGRSHVDDVDDNEIQHWLANGFHPTTDLTDIDAFVICVPTPSPMRAAPT